MISSADPVLIEALTNAEHKVAQAVTRGLHNRAIAHEFGISEQTVKKHLANIYAKLAIDDRLQLTIHLFKSGLPKSKG